MTKSQVYNETTVPFITPSLLNVRLQGMASAVTTFCAISVITTTLLYLSITHVHAVPSTHVQSNIPEKSLKLIFEVDDMETALIIEEDEDPNSDVEEIENNINDKIDNEKENFRYWTPEPRPQTKSTTKPRTTTTLKPKPKPKPQPKPRPKPVRPKIKPYPTHPRTENPILPKKGCYQSSPVGVCPKQEQYPTFLYDAEYPQTYYMCNWGKAIKMCCSDGLIFYKNSCVRR